jgi:anaerobic selenocysteine-containing dehydrogenase
MGHTRRNFLKLAGAAGLGAVAAPAVAEAAQQKGRTVASRGNSNGAKELPRNMTFCTVRRDGRFVLGVRTPRGVLDVEKAGKALRRPAPSTIDEVLQGPMRRRSRRWSTRRLRTEPRRRRSSPRIRRRSGRA